jgi:hypothetical protein
MLFECVALVLLAKYCIYLVDWPKSWPLPSIGAMVDLAKAIHRAAEYCRLGASIEVKQVPVEEVATYTRL